MYDGVFGGAFVLGVCRVRCVFVLDAGGRTKRRVEGMKKRIYLSHPYGGFTENRERAAALAKMYREIWDAEGKTDWELINPLEYFAPMAEEGISDETILINAVALMKDCDGVLFAPGWKHSRGCRYEHWKARHADGKRVKYFQAEIPAEVEEAAAHWFGKHHITTRRWAA